jgi:hypothetical protein
VPNSFEENDCENANTRAQGGDHLVVLAHLQRRWSLSGREGFGVVGFRHFRGNEMHIFHYASGRDFL